MTNPQKVDAGEHWMLLVAETEKKQVYVLNSMTTTTYDAEAAKFIEGWK